jgi:serine/threonine-protein kinase
MTLGPGVRLGPYEIQSLLGSGGMGEVYRATDTSLKRQIAIKALPASVADDPERLARFQREAEVLAALNHPNIAHIHGLEKSDGMVALVMELVEGPTLADLIARGPIPLDEALPIAKQIAEGLEAAHEQGIVHRDLKPANIKVRDDGTVKILDFGLAKALEPKQPFSVNVTQSPTITTPAMMTGIGIILGTAAYMSPEQAKGRPADKRSDVWAFGCVLYEMLAGRPAFAGEDVADTLANVLKAQPDWSRLPSAVPAHMVRLLKQCLDKQRSTRIPEVAVARFLLESDEEPRPARWTGTRTLSAAAIILLLTLIGVIAWRSRPSQTAQTVVRFVIDERLLGAGGYFRDVLLTPDGKKLVFVGLGRNSAPELSVRSLDRLDTVIIDQVAAQSIFVSPDGRWIGFGTPTELKKVPIGGGPAETICKIPAQLRGATWGTDNTIVFATADRAAGLLAVPASGGTPVALLRPDDAQHDYRWPAMLPGARALLFTIASTIVPVSTTSQIAVLDRKTGRHTVLMAGTGAEYVDTGHLVYGAGDSLMAIPFDADRLTMAGDPVTLAERVSVKFTGAVNAAVARGGTLAYVPAPQSQTMALRSVVWVDRSGREQLIDAPSHSYVYARLSPDQTRIALAARDQDQDLWSWDIARQTLTRLTADPSLDTSPIWTPDSRRIIFASQRAGVANLFSVAPDGATNASRLTTSVNPQVPTSMTPDGRLVIAWGPSELAGVDVIAVDASTGAARSLVHNGFNARNGEVSPDGRWLAYHSDESGKNEVYVRPFPNVDVARWLISRNGGDSPAWSADGRELFFVDANGTLTAVPVSAGVGFEVGAPAAVLHESNYLRPYATPGVNSRTYDVSRDGRRFLMIKDVAPGTPTRQTTPIVVVVNWTEELKQRVPTK